MHLVHLTLTNFRNYARLELALAPGITLLYGDNAAGKTNLLEAVFYLATARSPHAGAERELIRWGATEEAIPFARVAGQVMRQDGQTMQLEILLLADQVGEGEGQGRVSKRIQINGVSKRVLDLLGHLNVVLFLPEDLDLVFGSPSDRRRYLDTTLAQIDPKYSRALSQYHQVLAQRNALLKEFRERSFNAAELEPWNAKLVEHGTYIMARRAQAVDSYNTIVAEIYPRLTARYDALCLQYQPTIPRAVFTASVEERRVGDTFVLASLERIAAAFAQQLAEMRPRELGAAMTLVGPHRDDLGFFVDGVDMITYASRGQGRTIAISLKLAEWELMRAETGEEPVLLLDDVMSELDKSHRVALAEMIARSNQALVTTTDLDAFTPEFLAQARLLHVEEGRIAGADC